MASLVKKRQKYFIRIRLPGGKEKTISTGTGNLREAERRLRLIEDREILFKARLISEAELEDLGLQEATKRFIKDRKLSGRRPTTIDSYELAMQNLVDANTPQVPVSSLNRKHVQKMVVMLQKQKKKKTTDNLQDTTINIRIRSVNTFMNWLYKEGYILDRIKASEIKVDEPLPKFLTPGELDDLYAKVSNPKMLSTLKVYEGTGMRLSELHHSYRNGGFIIIPAEFSKSRRDRMIPIDEDLIHHYEIAMKDPFKPHTITHAFRKYADKVDPPIKKTLHSMRHTYALRMLQQTKDIVTVKELLGHADIKTTMIYTKFPPEYISEMLKVDPPEPIKGIVGQA